MAAAQRGMKWNWKLMKAYPIPFASAAALFSGIIILLLGFHAYANVIWFVALVLGGAPLIFETIRKVLKKNFTSDIIATLAIVIAILLGQSFAGVIIVIMQSGGEALEDYGFKRASISLKGLMERAPKVARRKSGNSIEEIDVKKVAVGDILVIRGGDLIPVDGTVISDEGYVDESALTGEPVPKTKRKGDKVLSGSVNVSGTFEIITNRISKESEYEKIVEIVKQAQRRKPGIQRLADKYAIYFTPITLVLAGAGYLITGKIVTVLSVLVVATPCPLIIAVPIAVIAGVNKAANESIIVKSGAAIEQIANARSIFFDKTGTITYGTPSVANVVPTGKYKKLELLRIGASVEQLSAHPFASSVVQKAKQESLRLESPSKFKEHPSRGVEGYIKGRRILVGSRKLYEAVYGKDFPKEYDELIGRANAEGRLCTYIFIGGNLEGIIMMHDQLRKGVQGMIKDLGSMGISNITMLTGDNLANARVIADAAGIKNYKTSLLPKDKVSIVGNETKRGISTIMVGDGINDAPALATATVGVAMGAHGTGISAEAADVVLLVDDVTKIADAIRIGKRMLRIAKQSIYFGLGASIVLMVIAAVSGSIPPAVGAVIQEMIDVSVILNAIRMH